MPQPLTHLYDLALRTLDDHERRADALRARLGPVLAATTLAVTLLSGPGSRPNSVSGKLALTVAVGSLLVVIVAAFRLVSARHRPTRDIDVQALAVTLERNGLLDDETAFYTAMLARLSERSDDGARSTEQLATTFTAMLWGILVMLCGLALAALVG